MKAWRSFGIVIILTILALFARPSYGYIVTGLNITVWEDGEVTVSESIHVEDYEIVIDVPFLGSNVHDIMVLAGRYSLPYEIENGSIRIIVPNLNVTTIKLVYTASDLVEREGSVWILRVSLDRCPANITFHGNVKILKVSDLPIGYSNSSIVIGPGNITIAFTYPDVFSIKESRSSRFIFIVLLVVVLVILGILKLKSREEEVHYRKDKLEKLAEEYSLNDEEVNAILYLLQKGGRCSQTELRKALDLPKTTAWRMVRRLEQKGLIRVYKVGRENWIELTVDMHKLT
ncbi:winged helix-turn-helix transcriptional regulator [Pyrococcus sp. ST04]|uniref:helix-turn-helix transcriptional regulator n=1 Tax=Pyrococcus sp. ST04 TaxID=1183377 RepID=UPI0002605E56|nr:winged helix-turn-helix transcriptional regulator [Pyrococcus sp. ST04]AFK22569.1 hypothetical protein Py04_0987 [Pyrococcus sp. ST04]